MEQFPVINLPDYFTRILTANMQVSGQNFMNLHSFVMANKPLNILVEKLFKELGKNIEVGRIIKSLGWVGFRNKVANAFLEYEFQGFFPEDSDESLMVDIINLEEDFRPYEVSGYSRAFLLGFYCKMAELKLKKEKKGDFYLDLSCISFLDFAGSKFPKLDWIFLQLLHFNNFIGDAKLKNHLTNKAGFDVIFSELKSDQQEQFARNMLAYGCSIGEADMFYETRV